MVYIVIFNENNFFLGDGDKVCHQSQLAGQLEKSLSPNITTAMLCICLKLFPDFC